MLTNTPISTLQPVLDAMSEHLAILDRDGCVVIVNTSWSTSSAPGLLTKSSPGDDFLSLCEPPAARGLGDVLSGESPEYAFDYPCATADGVSWHSVTFKPLQNGSRPGVLVTHRDVPAAGGHSYLALDSLIDASPLPIIALDTDYRVTGWNRAAERMFGWTEAEVLGRFNPIVPEDRIDEFLANALEARQSESGVIDLQVRRQRKDGSLIDVQISHAFIRDTNGEVRGAIAILSDISESRRKADQQAFLSEAAEVLAASLDYEQALTELTRIAVPRMADLCTVNLIEEDGTIRRLAATHYDPARQHLVDQVLQWSTIPPEVAWGTARVVKTREPEIKHWPNEPEPDESEAFRLLRQIGLGSMLTVPLLARDEVIGTIVLVYGDSGRTFTDDDLEVATDLAGRAAAAIDNARLYQEAREAESLYRAIVEHVPAITYLASPDNVNNLTQISNQTRLPKSMFHQGQVTDGKSWNTRLHPDDAERVRETMAACSASGAPLEVEYRIVYEDGEVVWRLDRADLIHDASGNPLHWLGLVVDITERKHAEEALRIRALQQAAVASLGQRAIGGVDLNQMIHDAANVVCETLETEFVRLSIYEPANDALIVRATAGQPTATGVGAVVELQSPSLMAYTFKSGSPTIVEDVATETRFVPQAGMVANRVQSALCVVIPGPGRPYGTILAATKRRQRYTEDDVNFLQSIAILVSATLEHNLDEEHLRFQAHLLDVISQAVVSTDLEGRITYWNQHAEDLYGWKREEVLGRPVLEVTPAEHTVEQVASLLNSLKPGENWSGDYTLRRKDGSTFPGWTTLSPILDRSGEVEGFVGVSADISERRQAHAEREQLVRDLGERVKELTVLHRAAALFESNTHDLDHILCELATIVPGGMQRPDRATVRLQVGDQWAASSEFPETPWSISAEFTTPEGGEGQIRVCYLDANPHDGAMLFLPEECSLLNSLADMFRAYLERIHSQDQVRTSEARFRAAAEGTLDAFGILEPVRDVHGTVHDYRFIEVNGRAEVLLRLSREQLIGKTMRQQFLQVQADMFVDAFNHVIQTGETIEREVEVPRETDSFWVLFQAVPLDDGVAVFASETTEQRRLESQLIYQAFHDALTGLPNRALFLDRVDHARERARSRQQGVAVLFLDLDNFKIINDSLGHGAGDQLLMAVAERLTSCIGSGDTAARLGGDEFAILLEDVADWAAVSTIGESIVNAFEAPFFVAGRDLFITPSIGVSMAISSTLTASDLLRDADAAMYRAKRNGKARVEIFDPSLTANVIERFEIENDLRRAIEREEFRVYYQPIVRMQSGEIASMEALLRWEHPVYGLLAPAHFIPIAEETGLIVQIGRHVLQAACNEAVAWNRDRPAGQAVKVSVNISPRQFRDPWLVENVVTVLDESGLEPALLYLELTESLMVEDEERVRETLQRLKGHGVGLAVDDFGTGYSSLGLLRRFPVDMVKIDRMFVSGIESNPQDAVMLSGIVDLAHKMNLLVVAEGVETPFERDRLREMGCDLAQGYLFARPLPADEIAPMP